MTSNMPYDNSPCTAMCGSCWWWSTRACLEYLHDDRVKACWGNCLPSDTRITTGFEQLSNNPGCRRGAHTEVYMRLFVLLVFDSEGSLYRPDEMFPAWCSGGRRPSIAECLPLQRLGVVLSVACSVSLGFEPWTSCIWEPTLNRLRNRCNFFSQGGLAIAPRHQERWGISYYTVS